MEKTIDKPKCTECDSVAHHTCNVCNTPLCFDCYVSMYTCGPCLKKINESRGETSR